MHRAFLWRNRTHDPALTGLLAVEGLIVFVAAPLTSLASPASHFLLESLTLAFALFILWLSRGRLAVAIATVAVVLDLTGVLLQLWVPLRASLLLAHLGSLTALFLATYVVGRAVFAPGPITAHRILGAVALYVNFGLMFATAYRAIWDLVPGSLSGIPGDIPSWAAYGSILYFSFVTLTSVGYGDIAPVHAFSRALSNLEAIIGQLFPATLLARLVTLELERRRH
jgi:hypothetical protein